MKIFSALLTRAPTPAPPVDEGAYTGDFLKLDNDVSISRDKIEIGTVLYDSRSSPRRARSWLHRLFSFIERFKEKKALDWVATFVGTRLIHLPGSENFVAHIQKQKGVRRDEFIDFLIEQRLLGISAKVLGSGVKNSFGNYQIADVAGAIIDRLSAAFTPSFTPEEITAFFAFSDAQCLHVRQEERLDAEAFVEKFSSFAKENPQHPLVSLLQGKVNLLAVRLQEDSAYFKGCQNFIQRLPSLPKVEASQSNIDGWYDFSLAVLGGAKGRTEYDEPEKSLYPIEYADRFTHLVGTGDADTKSEKSPDAQWKLMVSTVYQRYALRESRLALSDESLAMERILSSRGKNDEASLDAFFLYCERGPIAITRHSMTSLKAVTSKDIQSYCKENFKQPEKLERMMDCMTQLFSQLEKDLAVFEGRPPPIFSAESPNKLTEEEKQAMETAFRDGIKKKFEDTFIRNQSNPSFKTSLLHRLELAQLLSYLSADRPKKIEAIADASTDLRAIAELAESWEASPEQWERELRFLSPPEQSFVISRMSDLAGDLPHIRALSMRMSLPRERGNPKDSDTQTKSSAVAPPIVVLTEDSRQQSEEALSLPDSFVPFDIGRPDLSEKIDWTALGRNRHLDVSDMQLIADWIRQLDPNVADQKTLDSLKYLLELRAREDTQAEQFIEEPDKVEAYRNSLNVLVGYPAMTFLAKVSTRGSVNDVSMTTLGSSTQEKTADTSTLKSWMDQDAEDSSDEEEDVP